MFRWGCKSRLNPEKDRQHPRLLHIIPPQQAILNYSEGADRFQSEADVVVTVPWNALITQTFCRFSSKRYYL